ncbi:DUF4132 domain-containing protein [Micromonospora sp. NPDC049559]|uniref:DUF4132 domain-containing protein n=1 Tax=Micromonospora sp. NPDC049559 TaxID=3155923 RepID=UPI003446F8D9
MTDEETLVVPAAWYRDLHPRRGGAPVGYAPEPDAPARLAGLLADRPGPHESLSHPDTRGHVGAAGLAYLAGPGEGTPLGAAAAAMALIGPYAYRDLDRRLIADGWIAGPGIEFAVRAAVELTGLRCGPGHHLTPAVQPLQPVDLDDNRLSPGVVEVLARVRAALAAAPDDVHAAARAALLGYRDGTLRTRIATSFLAPDRADWVDEDVRAVAERRRDNPAALLLMASVTAARQVELVEPVIDQPFYAGLYDPAMLHTLAEGLGADGTGTFLRWWNRGYGYTATRRALLSVLAALPSDPAFRALLDHLDTRYVPAAVAEAAERYPRRALRLLAEAADGPRAAELLRRHVARHPELVEEMLPDLPTGAAERIRAAVPVAPTATVVAPVESLPALLTTPPWTVRRKAGKPVVLADLRCADEPTIAWEPGERERWRGSSAPRGSWRDVEAVAARIKAGTANHVEAQDFFETAPEELAAPLLAQWRPERLWWVSWWLPSVVARFELAAYPLAVALARRSPAEAGPHLLPYRSPEVALLMAQWLGRLKSARQHALAWLHRHPDAAARALVPAALAKPGADRRYAGGALVALAGAGHRELVLATARGYGAPAASAIEQLLDGDPLELLPARIPALPEWAEAAALPPIRLRNGSGALPVEAVRHVLTMCAISTLDAPYAGLAVVRDACTPESLGAFARALLSCWLRADAPPRQGWALTAQAFLGDDETARELGRLVREWPYEGAHARTAAGLDVLAGLGTDAALTQLHEIATKMKAKAVRTRAEARLRDVAQARGLLPEQLADRIVPRFGLADDRTLGLDYGPRRFVVGFDEQLRPYVTNEDGTRRGELPKPAASDDPELAPAAYRRFTALKRSVRTTTTEQVRRLEQAMVSRRRWSGAEFRGLFLRHPLLYPLARRLVWATYRPDAEMLTALRVAEDRSLADVEDDLVTVEDDAMIGVAHPAELGADLSAWSELLADYEILQPFEQLGREVQRLTEAERESTRLTRFDGVKAQSVKIVGLERRGWLRVAGDGGRQDSMERALPDGRVLTVRLEPGIALDDPTMHPAQTFEEIWIRPAHGRWDAPRSTPFGVLDPVTASELLRDLAYTTA